jgi:hypothetical protein
MANSPIYTQKAISLGWNVYTDNMGKLPKTFPKELLELIELNKQKILDKPLEKHWDQKMKDWDVRTSNPFLYPSKFYTDMILFKGMMAEESKDWIFVLNNAGYYKCHTKYAVWHTRDAKLFEDEKYKDKWFPGKYYLGAECGPVKYLAKQMDLYYFY